MLKFKLNEGQSLNLEPQRGMNTEKGITIVYEKADVHPEYPCCGCVLSDYHSVCVMMICEKGYQYHEKKEE